jgi:hypothetical protein
MTPRWQKMTAVLGGTETMREASKDLLPIHERESDAAYEERLLKTTFYNQTEITRDAMVGRPFSDPVTRADVPEAMSPLLEDIDLRGNKVDVFARDWFSDGLSKAFSHVLVDFPKPKERKDGRPRTLADDRAEKLRPYWVAIMPENLVFAHAEVVDGKEQFTHARWLENVTDVVGFVEIERQRIRGLTRNPEGGVTVTVWELREVGKSRRKEWVEIESRPYGLDFIPLVTYYAGKRESLMTAKPPLLDLADLNIAHWQSQSDQTAVLTVARFPMLAGSGVSEVSGGTLPIGPNISLMTGDAAGRFYYVEHTGRAIESGRNDLKDLEERMSDYGAQFLKKTPGNPTATARALDSAEATSPLQDMSLRFSDALTLAWQYTAAWLKTDPATVGTLEVTHDFGPEDFEAADDANLREARKGKDLSRQKYLHELKRRGALDDEFDFDENDRELEEELKAFSGKAMTDIDPEGDDIEPGEEAGPPAEA